MKFDKLPREAELNLLNLICPTGRNHKDVSVEISYRGRLEMTCHDCSLDTPMGQTVIYVNPNINS